MEIVPNWLKEAYLLQLVCYKERNLSFCTLYGVWGDDFHKKFHILEKKIFFVLFHWFFKCYYCSINLKRQSEHSGLRPDTSSLVYFEIGMLNPKIDLFIISCSTNLEDHQEIFWSVEWRLFLWAIILHYSPIS